MLSRVTTWILGATDPEMELIERLLREAGQSVAYAMADGRRIHPGNATVGDPVPCRQGETLVLVECALRPPDQDGGGGVVRCDHHRDGDPGFGRPPAAFLPASSIGQVLMLLAAEQGSENGPLGRWLRAPRLAGRPEAGALVYEGGTWYLAVAGVRREGTKGTLGGLYARWVQVPAAVILAAAADHCLAAAYRGECPGVDPDALMMWRAESRAAFQQRPVDALLADVEATRLALREALGDGWAGCALGGLSIADMRRELPFPELPEAAARDNAAYVSGPLRSPDGRMKYTCAGPAQVIEAWLRGEGIAADMVDRYGDPSRGFAGGYAAMVNSLEGDHRG